MEATTTAATAHRASRLMRPGACSRRSTCTAATAAGSRIPTASARFVPAVIDAIGMRAHGPLVLERFGDGELEGWSAMQFIETSSITIHADEVWGRCFVDVFSCRPFDPDRRGRDRRRALRRHAHRDGARAMSEVAPVLGVLAGVIGVADTIPYVRDTAAAADPAAPRDVADLGRARDRRLPVPARRRRIVEPDHGRHPGAS